MAEEIAAQETVERWLGRLAPSTARTSLVFLRKFMRWMGEEKSPGVLNGGRFAGYTPDELVAYQKEAENSQQYDILDIVQGYVGQLDLRVKSKKREYSALRSLFAHNRAVLPDDPTFRVRSRHTAVEGTLKLEEIRDMIVSFNKVYRAVFLCMFQGVLGLEEFDQWNRNGWEKLREDLRGDPELIMISFPSGRKLNPRAFYTLIGPDAIKALKDWIAVRPPDAEAIFVNQHGRPIVVHSARMYWLRHLEKLGFIERVKNGKKSNRYGKNSHEMRDVFRSQWEKSPAKGSVAEFMMGHQVDPLEYNKAFRDEEWVREQYLLALPMLQIMSSDTPFNRVNGKTVKRLEDKIAELESQIEMMVPAFKVAQRLMDQREELKEHRGAPAGL